jgi:hypothetical protein
MQLRLWKILENNRTITAFRIVEFLGVIVALGAFYIDFIYDRPQDRVIRAWGVVSQSNIGQGNIGQIAALKTLIKAGEDIRGINLNSAWLPDVNLSDVNLSHINFSFASLMNANFKDSTLINADFRGANLSRSNFTGSNMEGSKFLKNYINNGTNITGVDFTGAINIPNLSETCADPANPPKGLPNDVQKPAQWIKCI